MLIVFYYYAIFVSMRVRQDLKKKKKTGKVEGKFQIH